MRHRHPCQQSNGEADIVDPLPALADELRAIFLVDHFSRTAQPATINQASEARAAVQRRIAAARAALDAADGEVARAEEAATATEAPERKAYNQAVQAGHLLARARDDLAKAADADAGPARLLELRGRVSDAESVDQHERGKLAAARQATPRAAAVDCSRRPWSTAMRSPPGRALPPKSTWPRTASMTNSGKPPVVAWSRPPAGRVPSGGPFGPTQSWR